MCVVLATPWANLSLSLPLCRGCRGVRDKDTGVTLTLCNLTNESAVPKLWAVTTGNDLAQNPSLAEGTTWEPEGLPASPAYALLLSLSVTPPHMLPLCHSCSP